MTATVQAAIAAVMADLPGIGKDDRSPEGYQYRGIEAVTKNVQPLLAKHGVVLVPFAEVTDVRPSPAMKDGWTDVYMRVSWKIVGPDGSTLEAQTFGIGRDRADKGANKAMTQAFKYLLLDLLCIADAKDDADSHTYEHDRTDGPRLLAGWLSIEEQTAAHDELKAAVAGSSEGVQEAMRTYRRSRGFGWPLAKVDFDDLSEQLDAEMEYAQQVAAGGASTREGEDGPEPADATQPRTDASPPAVSTDKRAERAQDVASESGSDLAKRAAEMAAKKAAERPADQKVAAAGERS